MSIGYLSMIFFLLALLEVIYFKIANRFSIIDKPNYRSSHTIVVIRGGGIIFSIATVIFYFVNGFQYPYFITGVFLISLISFLDDLITLNNKIRLSVQLLSVVLLFCEPTLTISAWYWFIIAIVFAIGIINAYNFMDGINGITGAYSLVAVFTLYYINVYIISFTSSDLLLIIALALIVFNFFNFRRVALCFAGDVGSVSIAFIILFFLSQLIIKSGNLSYLLLLLVYGLDSVSTIIFRYIRKENIFEAHRSHFYQYLTNERKVPHLIVASIYTLLQLTVNAIWLFIIPHSIFLFCLSLLFTATVFIIVRFSMEGVKRLLENSHH